MELVDAWLEFSGAKKLFFNERRNFKNQIVVKEHCIKDHPNRMFSIEEIRNLIKSANGNLSVNNLMPSATKGSMMFRCKDSDDEECEFAFLIYDRGGSYIINVIHAWRKDKK